MSENYYTILGVPSSATHEELQEAYRRLARAFHPDSSGGDTARQFQRIQEAWETLGNAERRRSYDAGLNPPRRRARTAEPLRQSSWQRSGPLARRERALHLELELSTVESLHGGEVVVELPAAIACPECGGSGRVAGWFVCPGCHGQAHDLVAERFTLRVPAGLVDGQVIQIPLHEYGLLHDRLVLHVRLA